MAEKNQHHNPIKDVVPRLGKWPRRGLIALVGMAAVAAAYGLYWNVLADRVRVGIEQWAADRRAEGYEVSYAGLDVGGFPFQIEAAIMAPALSRPEAARPWSWRGPRLVISARPWRLSRVRLAAPGQHRITGAPAGRSVAVVLDAGVLGLELRFRDGKPAGAILKARDVVMKDKAGVGIATLAAADITVDRPQGKTVSAVDLSANVETIQYGREPAPGLGRTTERLDLEASVTGGLPEGLGAEALSQWRDRGGTVEIRRLDVRHGPLDVEGDGTLALDGDMQPMGAFTFLVRGFLEALDRLGEAGVIEEGPARLAKTVLGMLARKHGGDGGELKVPLSIQERWLYVGPVALGRMPVLRWD